VNDNGGGAGETEPREGAEQRPGRLPDSRQIVRAQAPGRVLDEQDHAGRHPDSEWLVSEVSARPPGGFRRRAGASGRLRGRPGPEPGRGCHVHPTRPGYAAVIRAGRIGASLFLTGRVRGHLSDGLQLLVCGTGQLSLDLGQRASLGLAPFDSDQLEQMPPAIQGDPAAPAVDKAEYDRLRQRYLKLHKTVGWIYVVGAMIVAPFGAYIQYFEERMQQPRSFTMAAASDAGLLMLTTAIALFFVLRGNIQQHRQWMTRSYAVALVFLEVRVISGVFGFDNSPMATEVIVWMCVICSVPIADIVLNWREFKRGKITQQKAAAAKAA